LDYCSNVCGELNKRFEDGGGVFYSAGWYKDGIFVGCYVASEMELVQVLFLGFLMNSGPSSLATWSGTV